MFLLVLSFFFLLILVFFTFFGAVVIASAGFVRLAISALVVALFISIILSSCSSILLEASSGLGQSEVFLTVFRGALGAIAQPTISGIVLLAVLVVLAFSSARICGLVEDIQILLDAHKAVVGVEDSLALQR